MQFCLCCEKIRSLFLFVDDDDVCVCGGGGGAGLGWEEGGQCLSFLSMLTSFSLESIFKLLNQIYRGNQVKL